MATELLPRWAEGQFRYQDEACAMGTLRICMFGKFSIEAGVQAPHDLETRKVQELLCYLLLFRRRPHPREALAELLCGGCPRQQSMKSLRQALWRVQSAVAPFLETGHCPLLLAHAEWVQLHPEADLWLDVAEFEQAAACARGVRPEQLEPLHVQALQGAESLYRGDLLEGCYQDWCLYERERLKHEFLALLEKLMAYHEAHTLYEAGLHYGERILSYDEASERTHQGMMRLHYLAGDRSASLRQYERCAAVLRRELDVEPSRRTRLLYDEIRADRLPGPELTHSADAPSAPASPPLPETLGQMQLHQLQQFQDLLSDMQDQVREQIRALQDAQNEVRG